MKQHFLMALIWPNDHLVAIAYMFQVLLIKFLSFSRAEIEFCHLKVFKNHGASAGASMSHSHSQIMALPVVPPSVSARLDSMKQHFDQTGRCSLCDIRSNDLLIDESAHFISIVPFAATFPFEIWIVPVDHSSHFHDIDGAKVVSSTSSFNIAPIKPPWLSKGYYQISDYATVGFS